MFSLYPPSYVRSLLSASQVGQGNLSSSGNFSRGGMKLGMKASPPKA